MPFGPARHLEAGVHQPALAVVVEIKTEAFVLDWLGGERGGLEHFGLQTHQHGGGQKGFAGLGQVLFVAATGGGHQPGHLNPLAQLVEKAIDNGNHIHIPGVEFPPDGCVLQQPDGQPGAPFCHRCCVAPWDLLVLR